MHNAITGFKFFSPRIEAKLAVLAIVGALLFLYLFGVQGLFRSSFFGFDFAVFHKAGVEFINGENPWLLSMNTGHPFSYPPHLGAVITLYGALPYDFALYFHATVNFASVISIAYLANRWFIGITNWKEMSLAQGICIAMIIGNPFMAHSVYQGQLSLPATACALWSWHFLQKDRWMLAGLFLGIATLKPQVSLLYIVWLMMCLNFRILLCGGVVALLMLLPSFVNYGIFESFDAWFKSMSDYAKVPANMPGFQHVVGLESVLVTLGIHGSGVILKPLSFVSLILLFIKRDLFSPTFTISLFFVIALTFIYGHDSDFVTLALMWSYFVYLGFERNSYLSLALAFGLLFIFFLPQRFLRLLDWPVIYQWRTFVILVCCYYLFRWERIRSAAP